MTEIITQILVEVLNIFGIATKELKRGSASEFRRIACVCLFTQPRLEKFLRKLAGMADLDNALKKLDRLTQEEARMANVEVLRLAHDIRDGVKIVDGKVEGVSALMTRSKWSFLVRKTCPEDWFTLLISFRR